MFLLKTLYNIAIFADNKSCHLAGFKKKNSYKIFILTSTKVEVGCKRLMERYSLLVYQYLQYKYIIAFYFNGIPLCTKLWICFIFIDPKLSVLNFKQRTCYLSNINCLITIRKNILSYFDSDFLFSSWLVHAL